MSYAVQMLNILDSKYIRLHNQEVSRMVNSYFD